MPDSSSQKSINDKTKRAMPTNTIILGRKNSPDRNKISPTAMLKLPSRPIFLADPDDASPIAITYQKLVSDA